MKLLTRDGSQSNEATEAASCVSGTKQCSGVRDQCTAYSGFSQFEGYVLDEETSRKLMVTTEWGNLAHVFRSSLMADRKQLVFKDESRTAESYEKQWNAVLDERYGCLWP
jgi:hypothetical protein